MLTVLICRQDLRQSSEKRCIAGSFIIQLLGFGWICVFKREEKRIQNVGKETSLKAATSTVGAVVNNELARMWVQAGVSHLNVLFQHFQKVAVGKT